MQRWPRPGKTACRVVVLTGAGRRQHLGVNSVEGARSVEYDPPHARRRRLDMDPVASECSVTGRGHRRPTTSRPMISFMTSLVPPKMRWTRASWYARATGYSIMNP